VSTATLADNGKTSTAETAITSQAPSRSQLSFLADLMRRAGLTLDDVQIEQWDKRSVSRLIDRLRGEQPVDDPEAYVRDLLAR